MSKPQKSYALWIAMHCLRGLATLLVFAICALVLWRVFISSRPPKEMKGLAVNDALSAAYAAHGEGLELYTQEQASVTRGERTTAISASPVAPSFLRHVRCRWCSAITTARWSRSRRI